MRRMNGQDAARQDASCVDQGDMLDTIGAFPAAILNEPHGRERRDPVTLSGTWALCLALGGALHTDSAAQQRDID